MIIESIGPDEYLEQRWKNGSGASLEIARDADEPWGWRVSLATIASDGPFSAYPRFDRTIVAVDGGPVSLTIDGRSVPLGAEPVEFRGESVVSATVTAPARDFNVITQRDRYVHDLCVVNTPERFIVDEDEIVLVYSAKGTSTVGDTRCDQGHSLYIDDGVQFDVVPDPNAHAYVVRITPR